MLEILSYFMGFFIQKTFEIQLVVLVPNDYNFSLITGLQFPHGEFDPSQKSSSSGGYAYTTSCLVKGK